MSRRFTVGSVPLFALLCLAPRGDVATPRSPFGDAGDSPARDESLAHRLVDGGGSGDVHVANERMVSIPVADGAVRAESILGNDHLELAAVVVRLPELGRELGVKRW